MTIFMRFFTTASLSVLGLLILGSSAFALAPNPVKVVAEATQAAAVGSYQVNNIDGIGNWNVPARLSERLEFWNVGEEGGEKYATATWTQTWIPEGNGEVVTEVLFNKPLNKMVWHREPAKTPPVIEPKTQTLRFSGGLKGTFTNENGNVTRYKIVSDNNGGLMVTGSNLALFIKNPEAFVDFESGPEDAGMRFSGMTGQVEWRADDDPDGWKLCKAGDKLPVYAHIRTQEDSSAILSFRDTSTFVLKPDSEVVLDTPPGPESKIKLVAGNIWANIKRIVKDGSMEVEMNQAVCGIKGTTFVLEDRNGISSLKVIEGKVQFTAKAGGGQTMVEGGSVVSATSKGIEAVQTFDVEKETKEWEDLRGKIGSSGSPVLDSKFFYPAIAAIVIILAIVGGFMLGKHRKKS